MGKIRVTATYEYEPELANYSDGCSLEEAMAEDEKMFQAGDLGLLDLIIESDTENLKVTFEAVND